MSKNIEKRIGEVRDMALMQIPAILGTNPVNPEDFRNKRIDMNIAVIQILIGADFDRPKDGKEWKVKFCHKLPSRAELAQIVQIMDVFAKTVEAPFMVALANSSSVKDGEDMGIPPKESDIINAVSGLPRIEKINSKKMKSYIFGYDDHEAMAKLMLNAADCMEIAAMGEDLRKKTNRNRMFIVGGIALLITGGTVAAVCIRNKKKDGDIIDMDDMDVDIDGDDSIDVGIDDDDAPVVTID